MTKDEIQTRIDGCKAELDSLNSGTGESSQPEADLATRRQHLEHEIASLQAQLEET